jgi:hypothetical protein
LRQGLTLLIFILALSGFSARAQGRNDESPSQDTETGFFDEQKSTEEEPLPQLDSEDSEEFSSELDKEPVPQIPRKLENYKRPTGPQRIQHPLAEKGLIRITKDKVYVYKTKTSPQKNALSVRFGMYDPVNLENPDNGTTFDDNYPEANNPMLVVEYEWQLWQGALGKLGLKVGSGLFFANGNGRYKNNYPENEGREPKEVFTFLAFPNTLGAVYRAQFMHRQYLVPYADGGVMGFTFTELRDDGASPRFGFSPAAYASGGIALNLSLFDSLSSLTMDSEYGINAVYLTAEYRNIISLGGSYDLSSDLISGGFMMEF